MDDTLQRAIEHTPMRVELKLSDSTVSAKIVNGEDGVFDGSGYITATAEDADEGFIREYGNECFTVYLSKKEGEWDTTAQLSVKTEKNGEIVEESLTIYNISTE